MLLSRSLSQYEYGNYRLIWLLITILSLIFVFGLPGSITYFVSGRSHKEQQKYFGQTMSLLAVSSLVQIVLLYVFRNMIASYFNNPDIAYYILISLPVFMLYPYTHIYSPALVAKGHVISSAAINIVYSILFVAGVAGVAYTTQSVFSTLVAFDVVLLVYTLVAFSMLFYRFKNTRLGYDWSSIKEQGAYALPLGAALSLELISKFVDKIIVGSFVSTSEYSIYANGSFELPFVGMISGAVMAILFPEFVKYFKDNKISKIINIWKESIGRTGMIVMPIMIYFIAYSNEIIVLMYTDRYAASASIFMLYLFILPLRLTIVSQVLAALNQNKAILKFTVYGLIVNVILTWFLVKSYGMVGAPIGTILAIYFVNGMMLHRVSVVLKSQWHAMLPWVKLSLYAFLSIIPLWLVKTFNPWDETSLIGLFVSIVAFGSVYLLIIFLVSNIIKFAPKRLGVK